MFKHTILIVLLGFLMVSSAFAESALQLPDFQPELGVTDAAALGHNDKDIGLKAGDRVPDFVVQTHDGKPMALKDMLAQAPLLIVFYRGGWCPYCNMQVRQLTKAWPEFEKRNITPVLISADKPDAASLAQRTYEIPFPVLSDPDLKAHEAFDVVLEVDDKTYELYKTYGIELEQWSGRGHHKIAVTAAFILGRDGVVQWAHTTTDYTTRPSVKQLLGVVDGL